MVLRVVATFEDGAAFLAAHDSEVASGGLLARGEALVGAGAMAECLLEVRVGGRVVAEVPARVAAVMEGVGTAVVFAGPPAPLQALAERLRAGERPGGDAREDPGKHENEEEEEPETLPGTAAARIRAMTATQKIQLALGADREERFALLRDPNKVLHLYVLKNPRTGQDEVLAAAKLTTLSPDALKFIAEHHEWGANATIATALVRNPKTPITLALKLLERIPASEVRAIAKAASARTQIVQAARRRVHE